MKTQQTPTAYQTYKRDSKKLARILDTVLIDGRMDTVEVGIHRLRIDHTRKDGLITIDLI